MTLFENLTQDDLEYLSSNSKKRYFKKNSVIVSEGNKRNFVYIIKSGKVKLYKSSKDGKNIILGVIGKNSVLGLAILFSNRPNPSTITTIEDSEIYLVKTCDLEKIILNNPMLASNIIRIISNRLLLTQEKARDLALENSYGKTIKMILFLSKTHGTMLSENSQELNLNLTRSELASFIGISRETLSRTLSQLNKEGYIDIEDKKIIIKDILKLKECLK